MRRHHLRMLGAVLLSAALANACSTDDERSSNRNGAPGVDGGDDSSGDGTGKKPKKKGTPGGEEPTDSLAIFSQVLHPLVKERCGRCHAATFAPFFASDDAAASLDAMMVSKKVDLENPGKSRLVLRLSEDKHQYWSDPVADAAEMQAAIEEWAKSVKDSVDTGPVAPMTAPLKLANVEKQTIEFKNPPDTFVFEAEAGTLKAPMAAIDVVGRGGGKVIETPANAGNANNANQALNNANLGTAIYTVNVTQAGTYTVHGLVNAPAAANASFYIRLDNANALQQWRFNATGMDYVWDIADTIVGVGTPTQLNLTAGMHTIEIRQRQQFAKLDMIAITSNPMFNGMTAKPDGSTEVQVLTYDISEISGVPGAKFQIEVKDYSENSYLFKNPKIISDKPLTVKDVRLLVNGEFLAQHATFTIVDKTVAAPGEVLINAALVAIKDKGSELDEFSFSFGTIQQAQ